MTVATLIRILKDYKADDKVIINGNQLVILREEPQTKIDI